ncbi:MAG: short-chain dehydrogenase [Sphingomonas bacterium]|uniref:SDR family oxidoreductase n=1 Tax=Sphingomonas bacterium TaxID=1895847 RepID=UPI0026218265|nr:SDR family NAD(P)-dependent oxidoreductase [Sphingomonas bacterium]MDB5695255.1 short-chain dehydrogenase [Sphingomonas bacterium]
MAARTVLVTGGAKRLGAAIVRRLAADGHRLIIHYGRSVHEAAALADEIGGAGIVGGDLHRLDAIDELWSRARKVAGGPIDGLVNSASLFVFDRPEAVDIDLAAQLYAVNCTAAVLLAQSLYQQGVGGAVVNLLDQKVANPNPDFFSYTLAKQALAAATTLMAQAFAPTVRVNAVSPGLTLASGDQTAAEFNTVACKNLLERPVGAEAVADAVAYLIGAESVTGQNLFVDNGQRFLKRDGDVMFEGRGQ